MLLELRISNFAVIESLSIHCEAGLNALTGETGAGKSIIVGALGLLLGERASTESIRTGAAKATVEGVFDVARRKNVLHMLSEQPDSEEGRRMVERIKDAVRGGTTLSTSLEQQHGVFSRLYVNMVRAGEVSGSLTDTLKRLALDMVDIIDRRRQHPLIGIDDAVRHVLRRQARILPGNGHHRDADVGEDVDRGAHGRQNPADRDQDCHYDEGQRTM